MSLSLLFLLRIPDTLRPPASSSFVLLFGKPNKHVFDVQRLPGKRSLGNSSLAGSANGRARLPADSRLSSRCPHSGFLPGGATTPVAVPHCARGLGSGVGNGVAALPCGGLGAPSSEPVYSACSRVSQRPRSLRRGAHASLWVSQPLPSTAGEAQPLAHLRVQLRDSPSGRADH